MGTNPMKTLGFAPDLIPLILDGSKTVSWRLFDDKNLNVGDEVVCVHQFTRQPFAIFTITSLIIKRLKDIDEIDRKGHEKVGNLADIIDIYQKYYSKDLTGDEEAKIIRFLAKKL